MPVIEIPRCEGESARAYEARALYVTMGANRSIESVAQKLGKSSALIGRWSSRHEWVESARRYDEAVTYLTVQDAATAYRRELEDHRERAGKAGKALYGVAIEMLGKLRVAPVEYTPATLATIARALTVALDIEAHGLRIADLLPKLEATSDDR
jgi:hypothetical protein